MAVAGTLNSLMRSHVTYAVASLCWLALATIFVSLRALRAEYMALSTVGSTGTFQLNDCSLCSRPTIHTSVFFVLYFTPRRSTPAKTLGIVLDIARVVSCCDALPKEGVACVLPTVRMHSVCIAGTSRLSTGAALRAEKS